MAQDLNAQPRLPEENRNGVIERAIPVAAPEVVQHGPEGAPEAPVEASELLSVREKIAEASQGVVRNELTEPQKVQALAEAHVRVTNATTDEARISELLGVAHSHGLAEAKKMAEKSGSAHVIDELHDRFVNEIENKTGGQ